MRPQNWRRGTLRGLQASFWEGGYSSQPHAPPTPGATAGGGLALAGGCFPVWHGPVPVVQGHSPCPHPRPPGAESPAQCPPSLTSPTSYHPCPGSAPPSRPIPPCRGPARAEASREQGGWPGTGRDGTGGGRQGSDVYWRMKAAGTQEEGTQEEGTSPTRKPSACPRLRPQSPHCQEQAQAPMLVKLVPGAWPGAGCSPNHLLVPPE